MQRANRYILLMALPIFLLLTTEVSALSKLCVFSEVNGLVLLEGKPVVGAKVKRLFEYDRLEFDETVTDNTGAFFFPAVYQRSIASLLPREFVVAQSMLVTHQGEEVKIWSNTKRSDTENSELGGAKLNLSCELSAELTLYREFGSILRTNCSFGEAKGDSNFYLFSEHFKDTSWLKDLPSGSLSELVDLTHSIVSVKTLKTGYSIYVGPINPDLGGSAISISLDQDFVLVDHYIEHLAIPD